MGVIFGSARIDENGKAIGGRAGDQTGKEVSTQAGYIQSNDKKRWRLLRPISAADAELIASTMQDACDNNYIGYDQGQRYSLWDVAEPLGFDLRRVNKPTECDCSELIRVILARLGMRLPKFRTTNQVDMMLPTGRFALHDEEKYTRKLVYLRRGDILVTRIQGHTVAVLSDGSKAREDDVTTGNPYAEPTKLIRRGSKGNDVRWVQFHLDRLGYDLGRYGIDGDFGAMTDTAVRVFQLERRLEVDGIVGKQTRSALKA